MNETQVNEFMVSLNQQYVQADKRHKRVIKNYMNDLLSPNAYKELDKKYSIQLETIKKTINIFLTIKNQ